MNSNIGDQFFSKVGTVLFDSLNFSISKCYLAWLQYECLRTGPHALINIISCTGVFSCINLSNCVLCEKGFLTSFCPFMYFICPHERQYSVQKCNQLTTGLLTESCRLTARGSSVLRLLSQMLCHHAFVIKAEFCLVSQLLILQTSVQVIINVMDGALARFV